MNCHQSRYWFRNNNNPILLTRWRILFLYFLCFVESHKKAQKISKFLKPAVSQYKQYISLKDHSEQC